MKGQISIEFLSLLSIALLASSILVTTVSDRNIALQERNQQFRAEQIAEKTSYKIEYVLSNKNSSVELGFSPELEGNYTVNISSRFVTASVASTEAGVRTLYEGGNRTISTDKTYNITYEEGLIIE